MHTTCSARPRCRLGRGASFLNETCVQTLLLERDWMLSLLCEFVFAHIYISRSSHFNERSTCVFWAKRDHFQSSGRGNMMPISRSLPKSAGSITTACRGWRYNWKIFNYTLCGGGTVCSVCCKPQISDAIPMIGVGSSVGISLSFSSFRELLKGLSAESVRTSPGLSNTSNGCINRLYWNILRNSSYRIGSIQIQIRF